MAAINLLSCWMFDWGLGVIYGKSKFRNLSFIDLGDTERCFASHFCFDDFQLPSASLLA